jgi:hypothetical protein
MADAFRKTDESLALFEKQDHNSERLGYISRGISNFLASYTEIYTEKKKKKLVV